ncbi:transglutaminase domain-containing protein [Polaribacter cellanae]|uniref:Transglutaminase n=1 Tax=Polaribacter cellanae TaxID=2818493 RepID=A0A975H6Q3_9FLAO|nr:transglutaminase domain-containing protein [Polaribacter cellanae]QTE22243.1 transglutaminase [Polaribacter cellanae]
MKYLLTLFLLISISVNSQDFAEVDAKVTKYPRFSKVEDLATKIDNDFSKDEEKARAAFFWLAKNIRYNLKEFYNPKQRSIRFSYASEAEKLQKLQAAKNNLVNATFKTKQGVCEEYAQSFKRICDLLGLNSKVIKGYARNTPNEIGIPANTTNHAWNAIQLNEKWIILDATWAAGYEYNGKWIRKFNNYFYNIPKEKIFKTHFPDDSLWVLRFGRMSLSEFYNQPIYGHNFLNSNIELLSPQNGIIKAENGKNIILKFKNLALNSAIIYNFKGYRYAQKPVLKMENGITIVSIPNPKKNSELYLYFNNEVALQFKTK